MKRYILILYLLCFAATAAHAQRKVAVVARGLTVDSAWTEFSHIRHYTYQLVNTGSKEIYDTISTHMRINGADAGKVSDTIIPIAYHILPYDSADISFSFNTDSKYFKKGNNLIVVWPTGTLFNGPSVKDSGKVSVIVVESSGINEASLHGLKGDPATISLYPQPAGQMLYLKAADTRQYITQVHVADINGREIYSEKGPDIRHIHTDNWPSGIYILEARLSDGSTFHSRFTR